MVRGLLYDSDIETVIWKTIFQKLGRKFEEQSSCLCLTVPPIMPSCVSTRLCEMVYEDFNFDAMLMATSHSMIRQSVMQEQ